MYINVLVQNKEMPHVDILHRSTHRQNTRFIGKRGLFQIFMVMSWKNCSIWKQVSLAQRKTFKMPVFLLKVKRWGVNHVNCKMLNCRLDRRSVGLMVLGGCFGFTAMGMTVLVVLDKSLSTRVSIVQNKKKNRTRVVMNAATFPSCRDKSFFPATLLEVLS